MDDLGVPLFSETSVCFFLLSKSKEPFQGSRVWSSFQELPLHIRQLFEARWRHFLGETLHISSYQMLRPTVGGLVDATMLARHPQDDMDDMDMFQLGNPELSLTNATVTDWVGE